MVTNNNINNTSNNDNNNDNYSNSNDNLSGLAQKLTVPPSIYPQGFSND